MKESFENMKNQILDAMSYVSKDMGDEIERVDVGRYGWHEECIHKYKTDISPILENKSTLKFCLCYPKKKFRKT